MVFMPGFVDDHGTVIFCVCLVVQSCLTLCDSMDCSLPGSSVHGDFPGKNTGVGFHALLQGFVPNPGIEPGSPTLQVDSLYLSHQGLPPSKDWGIFPGSCIMQKL